MTLITNFDLRNTWPFWPLSSLSKGQSPYLWSYCQNNKNEVIRSALKIERQYQTPGVKFESNEHNKSYAQLLKQKNSTLNNRARSWWKNTCSKKDGSKLLNLQLITNPIVINQSSGANKPRSIFTSNKTDPVSVWFYCSLLSASSDIIVALLWQRCESNSNAFNPA